MVKKLTYGIVWATLFLTHTNLQVSAEETQIDIGGAVRLNYSWKDYGTGSNGTFDFELFRIDVDVKQGKWFLDAQYR